MMHRAGTGASRRPGFGRQITSQSSSLSLFQLHGPDEHTPDVMWLPHAAGRQVGHRCPPVHIITPPVMTHRSRDNGRPTMSDRVPCHKYQVEEPHSVVWATAHPSVLLLLSSYQQALIFFWPSLLPTPTHRSFPSSTVAKYTELGSPLFRAGHQSSTPPRRNFQGPAAGPDPLSSSHVRTLPDVALRWGLASAVARLASSRLHFVRIFLLCFSGFGACFARHKSRGGRCNAGNPGPVLGSGGDQANAGAKTCIPADWDRPRTATAVCLRRLCQTKDSALWGSGTLMAPPPSLRDSHEPLDLGALVLAFLPGRQVDSEP